MEHQMVVFNLENEQYGVEIAAVESIIKMQEITRLPYAPNFVDGITRLRGGVVPVIDLRKRFGLVPGAHTRNTRIMISALNDASKVGLVVDAVTQVIRIADEIIEPPPQLSLSASSAFIKGIAKMNNHLIILLDLSRVLSLDEKEALAATNFAV